MNPVYTNDFFWRFWKWMVDIIDRHLRQHETSFHHAFLIKCEDLQLFGGQPKWSLPLNQLANIAIIPWWNEVVSRVMEELGQKADKVDVTGTTELRKVTHCHKGFGCSWMPLFMMMSHVIRDEYLRCLSGYYKLYIYIQSYSIRIFINHKPLGPYQPTSIMECKNIVEHCSCTSEAWSYGTTSP